MDEQLRNRFRRYNEGAPLRPRPNAPPSRVPNKPSPQAVPAALPSSPAVARPTSTSSGRDPIPLRPIFERPEPRPKAEIKLTNLPKPKRTKSKKSGKRGRKLLILLIILLLLGGGAAAFWFEVKPRLHRAKSQAAVQIGSTTTKTTAKTSGKLIRLVAVGDSMAYSSLNQVAQSGSNYDYTPLMTAIKPLFAKADVRICSQAVPAAGTAGGGVNGPPTFNAPSAFAKSLETTGCNVFDLASPDINDHGQAAIDASVGNFDNDTNILAIAGANRSADEQNKIRYFTVDGLKFAYLSYTTGVNVANPTPFGVNVYSDALADAQIKEAHQNAGFVLVSIHWGTDQTDTENAQQDTIAQHLASDNVDVVIGNGPHVIEPVKVLTGSNGHQSLIWFSLGNFLNSQVPVNTVMGGMAVMDIDSGTGQLHNPRLLPLYMHYEWTAQQAQRQTDADLLARKNFQLLPLDQAAALLPKSQNNTTIQAQQDRIKAIVNKDFAIPLITSADF